jgi:aminoglycoside phosphotransferase (APT) family kinase protein
VLRDVDAMPALIEAFLTDRTGRRPAVTGYELLTGGYSRVMAIVQLVWPDGRRERLVVRGDPPPAEALLFTDRDLEWAVLGGVHAIAAVPAPAPRWYCGEVDRFGTKVIFLEHVDAPSLQASFVGGLEPAGQTEAVIDLMAAVAAVEPDRLPPEMARPADWDTYLGGAIDEWRAAEAEMVESSPITRWIAAWLDAHRPPPLPLRLVHGDFQAANILHAPGGHQLVDWEYARIGDPREDLGYYNAYSLASPPNLYALDPEAFLARYRERTGFDEAAVNQLTVGYFTVLSTIKIMAGLYRSATDLARGDAGGAMASFNVLSTMFAHGNFVAAINGIDQAMAAAGAAS